MISVREAKLIVMENLLSISPRTIPLEKALGMVCASDIIATLDIPAFRQSSMDGYAFAYDDWKSLGSLRVKGEMAAGGNIDHALDPGTAARIFTGAPVPSGADTVIMQEKVLTTDGNISITDPELKRGNSIREIGSEIRSGSIALSAGERLSPAAIGFLAGIGKVDVNVYTHPTISLIITGDELQQPGTPLRFGQVYESNSFTLQAMFTRLGWAPIKVLHAIDTLESVTDALNQALAQSDIVLLTGGISVGDYDYVLRSTEACRVKQLFHQVRQRPGKPLYFGRKDNKLVYGLPGNPSSVLTCFLEYVLLSLEGISHNTAMIRKMTAPLAQAFRKPAGLTHFLKSSYDGHQVTLLDAQESYRLSSFARANCLTQVDEEVTDLQEGELVEIHLIPT